MTRKISGLFFILFLLLSSILSAAVPALADAIITPANITIPADLAGGPYTPLGAIAVIEGVPGDIAAGSFTLTIPAGFEFNAGSAPDVVVTGTGNLTAETTALITATTITVTVTGANSGPDLNTLTIGGTNTIQVRPTAATPLASGNILMTSGTIAGVTGATSFGTLTEVAGTATKLSFTTQPGGAPAGLPLNPQPVMTVQDTAGNTVTTFTGNMTIEIGNNPGGGSLSGTKTIVVTGGTAAFIGLSISKAGTGYTLTATSSPALTPATSNAFDITKVLTSIAVTPANPSIEQGSIISFAATGTYSDNTSANLTGTATWTSSNATVAMNPNAGQTTGLAAGTTTITATSGSISGNTTLTVTALPPEPVSYTNFLLAKAEPVLTGGGAGAWDQNVREKTWVIKDGPIFKMWYAGHTSAGEGTSKIGYATSTDGHNWTKYPGNPVISIGNHQYQDITLVKVSDALYHMYVETDDHYVYLFTSSDGINWTAYGNNPVKSLAASPVVWKEGTNWYLLYESMINYPTTPAKIYLATSTDGIQWTDSPSNPVLAEPDHVVPDSIVKEGTTYHLYYHRGQGVNWPAWHATSTDLINWTDHQMLFYGWSSQYTMATSDGQIWSYIWNLADGNYYIFYGLPYEDYLNAEYHWMLDEGSGTVATDASGSGRNGTLTNGPTWTTGQIGGGLSFDGTNDYVNVGNMPPLTTWTISVWVRSPAAPSSASASGPINRDMNFQINWNHPYAAYRGAAALSVGGTWYSASFLTLNANTWYHLAATYDGESLKAYNNGVLKSTNADPSGNADVETASLKMGRHAAAAQYFQGTIDEVRVYSRALTAAEVVALP